jgi:hypothetical protein
MVFFGLSISIFNLPPLELVDSPGQQQLGVVEVQNRKKGEEKGGKGERGKRGKGEKPEGWGGGGAGGEKKIEEMECACRYIPPTRMGMVQAEEGRGGRRLCRTCIQ